MSAALQLPAIWEEDSPQRAGYEERRTWKPRPAVAPAAKPVVKALAAGPVVSLGFYRKHTESLLRRYLYASMQVGRAPNILGDPIARGWCSSRPIRTFEDAVIFVLDIENCLSQLSILDRELLGRVVLQDYTQEEAALMLGIGIRTVGYRFPLALDRLTEKLLAADLLVLPH